MLHVWRTISGSRVIVATGQCVLSHVFFVICQRRQVLGASSRLKALINIFLSPRCFIQPCWNRLYVRPEPLFAFLLSAAHLQPGLCLSAARLCALRVRQPLGPSPGLSGCWVTTEPLRDTDPNCSVLTWWSPRSPVAVEGCTQRVSGHGLKLAQRLACYQQSTSTQRRVVFRVKVVVWFCCIDWWLCVCPRLSNRSVCFSGEAWRRNCFSILWLWS